MKFHWYRNISNFIGLQKLFFWEACRGLKFETCGFWNVQKGFKNWIFVEGSYFMLMIFEKYRNLWFMKLLYKLMISYIYIAINSIYTEMLHLNSTVDPHLWWTYEKTDNVIGTSTSNLAATGRIRQNENPPPPKTCSSWHVESSTRDNSNTTKTKKTSSLAANYLRSTVCELLICSTAAWTGRFIWALKTILKPQYRK